MDYIERIFYHIDKIIYFDFDDKNNNFFLKINQDKIEIEKKNEMAFLFYISLLIRYNINIVNYSYSIGFIIKINSINKFITKNTIYKKILISKIILELINFYKSNQIFKEKNNQEEKQNLNEIEKENINVIEKYINCFENIGLKINEKDLKLKGIDLIYAEIINILLKSKDFDLIYKIIEQLDLENMNITEVMFNEINKTLFSNEIFINEYRLNTFDDLFDSKKIDFYYILFKYIFKNQMYIYYIDFLNETKKNIFEIIHLEQNQFINSLSYNSKKIDNNFKDKITYIIKFFTNSDYYMKYINQNNSNILNSKLSDNKETDKSSFIPSENLEKEKSNSEGSKNDQSEKTLLYESNLSDETLIKKFYDSKGGQLINNNKSDMDSNQEINVKNEMIKELLIKVEYALVESTIKLIINNKGINYKELEYSKRKISYEELMESQKQKFNDEKDSIFENYKKLINYLNKILDLANKIISKSQIDLVIEINLKQDIQNSDCNNKIINSEYSLENGSFIEVKNCQDKNILNNNNYEGFVNFSNGIANHEQLSSIKKN